MLPWWEYITDLSRDASDLVRAQFYDLSKVVFSFWNFIQKKMIFKIKINWYYQLITVNKPFFLNSTLKCVLYCIFYSYILFVNYSIITKPEFWTFSKSRFLSWNIRSNSGTSTKKGFTKNMKILVFFKDGNKIWICRCTKSNYCSYP